MLGTAKPKDDVLAEVVESIATYIIINIKRYNDPIVSPPIYLLTGSPCEAPVWAKECWIRTHTNWTQSMTLIIQFWLVQRRIHREKLHFSQCVPLWHMTCDAFQLHIPQSPVVSLCTQKANHTCTFKYAQTQHASCRMQHSQRNIFLCLFRLFSVYVSACLCGGTVDKQLCSHKFNLKFSANWCACCKSAQ